MLLSQRHQKTQSAPIDRSNLLRYYYYSTLPYYFCTPERDRECMMTSLLRFFTRGTMPSTYRLLHTTIPFTSAHHTTKNTGKEYHLFCFEATISSSPIWQLLSSSSSVFWRQDASLKETRRHQCSGTSGGKKEEGRALPFLGAVWGKDSTRCHTCQSGFSCQSDWWGCIQRLQLIDKCGTKWGVGAHWWVGISTLYIPQADRLSHNRQSRWRINWWMWECVRV